MVESFSQGSQVNENKCYLISVNSIIELITFRFIPVAAVTGSTNNFTAQYQKKGKEFVLFPLVT